MVFGEMGIVLRWGFMFECGFECGFEIVEVVEVGGF
jgi:hypothetical protein